VSHVLDMITLVHGIGPAIAGTQIPVRRLYGWYKQGIGVERMLKRYPGLRHAQIFSALAYAFDHIQEMESALEAERELLSRP
jgi:uncharacterized protein (DUF433 family)